jgi:hypothetical protein
MKVAMTGHDMLTGKKCEAMGASHITTYQFDPVRYWSPNIRFI